MAAGLPDRFTVLLYVLGRALLLFDWYLLCSVVCFF